MKPIQFTQQLKGALLVFFGAMSYGILATIVKYANNQGVHTSVLTFMQFFAGVLFLIAFARTQKRTGSKKLQAASKVKLLLYGTTFGMTSIFYYLSIRYIPVSMGIILLMQSIWMSVALEAIVQRTIPTTLKIIGTITILAGTILATNVLFEVSSTDWRGILLGMLAAGSYTISLYASSNIETESSSSVRSQYLILGGFLFVVSYWNLDIIEHFNTYSGIIWGVLLALFGTIIPPLLFTKGIPLVGIGIGAIIAAVEIPVSILSAHWILDERINLWQWMGVLIILISVVLVNKKNIPGKKINAIKQKLY